MREGNSIDNAIIIETQDYISGMVEVHNRIDQICRKINCNIISVEQSLILKNDKKYDLFIIEMDDGSERAICFDITSFFNVK